MSTEPEGAKPGRPASGPGSGGGPIQPPGGSGAAGQPVHRPFPAGTPQTARTSYSTAPASPATGHPRPKRSAAEIRASIEEQRNQLGTSVEELRGRVNDLTDWKLQVRKHKRELIIGAAVVGFAIGGLAALRRRR